MLPRHIGYEERSAKPLRNVAERLRVPVDCRETADVVAREHGNIHRSGDLSAAALRAPAERCDAIRKPERFADVLLACECDARGRLGFEDAAYPQRPRLLGVLAAVQSVVTRHCGPRRRPRAGGPTVGGNSSTRRALKLWRSGCTAMHHLRQNSRAFGDVLHNPRESVIVRIGIGRKAALAANSRAIGKKKQRSGLPEAALSQTAGSYADGMDVSTYTAVGAVGLLPDTRWGLAVTASKCQSGSSSQPPLNRRPHHAIYCNAASHRNGYCQARVPAARRGCPDRRGHPAQAQA